MKKADFRVYKERLLGLRARLRDDVTSLAEAALRKSGNEGSEASSMPIHMAELGSDNYEQEFTLSLMATEKDTLGMIEAALERIENSTYGTCLECEGPVPKTRLNAIPHAPYCVKCASLRDHEMAG